MIVLVGILLAGYFYFNHKIVSSVIEISESKIDALMTTAVNQAVFLTLEDKTNYEDVVTVTRNESGDIQLLAANSVKINYINRLVAYTAQEKLGEYYEEGLPVPLGTLSGIRVLSGYGREIYLDIVTIGNVTCQFYSEFDEAGINQTRHSVYLNVRAETDIVIPTRTKTVCSETSVLICEAVIVGKVPEFYLHNSIFASS
ncbi:MAG: sporulation protein YunB [Firmicutes bacterium]|nr:sporulation protein YunB [Bacillota bacterium]